ncbi:MAG: hypothetical protein ABIP03_08320 [Aquihabitans sp.]
MARRVLLALLLVALGVLGAAWYSMGTFTMTRRVVVEPPSVLYGQSGVSASKSRVYSSGEMRIKCSGAAHNYVTDDGETMMFNSATGTPESAAPLCDEARTQRRQGAVGFVLVGLFGGGAVLAAGRMRDRRAAGLQVGGLPAGAMPHPDSAT